MVDQTLSAKSARGGSIEEPVGTVYGTAIAQLGALCRALGKGQQGEEFVHLFAELVSVCDDRQIGLPPRWSGVTNDCTPFEFSIAIRNGGRFDVRALFEAQADPPSAATYWDAGRRVNARLAELLPVDLSTFDAVADLFVPDSDALYAIWHGLEFRDDGHVGAKIYLNPLAKGPSRAWEIADAALLRLGYPDVREFLSAIASTTASTFARPQHVGLQLGPDGLERVKVYIRFRGMALEAVEKAYISGRRTPTGEVSSFFRGIAGLDWVDQRPIVMSFSFTDQSRDMPVQVAMFAMAVLYASNDGMIRDRILALLSKLGLPQDGYLRAIMTLFPEPLGRTEGLHTYVSFQHETQGPRVTPYFSGRLYQDRYGAVALDPPRTWPAPVLDPATSS